MYELELVREETELRWQMTLSRRTGELNSHTHIANDDPNAKVAMQSRYMCSNQEQKF